MEFTILLQEIANRYKDKQGKYPNKTKLIKLAYLAELFYKRWTGNRITETEWIYWHYGPYVMNYDDALNLLTGVKLTKDDYFTVVTNDNTIDRYDGNIEIALQRALEFSRDDLFDILDFIYFDTEPMRNAKKRGELLDFNCVLPESYYKTIQLKLPEENVRQIRKKVKNWFDTYEKK